MSISLNSPLHLKIEFHDHAKFIWLYTIYITDDSIKLNISVLSKRCLAKQLDKYIPYVMHRRVLWPAKTDCVFYLWPNMISANTRRAYTYNDLRYSLWQNLPPPGHRYKTGLGSGRQCWLVDGSNAKRSQWYYHMACAFNPDDEELWRVMTWIIARRQVNANKCKNEDKIFMVGYAFFQITLKN